MWEVFTVKVYHGGHLQNRDHLHYEGGDITFWDNCDMDRWSFFEIKDDLKDLGYVDNYQLMYANPSVDLEASLTPIIDDKQVMEMGKIGMEFGTVNLYVVHGENVLDDKSGGQSDLRRAIVPLDFDFGHGVSDKGDEVEKDKADWVDLDGDKDDNEEGSNSDDDEDGSSSDDDEDGIEVNRDTPRRRAPRGLSDDDYDSESLHTQGSDSEEDRGEQRRFPRFTTLKNMSEFKWDIGTIFGSKSEFRVAVKDYAVHSGRAVKFVKNDNLRCKAVCNGGNNCKWEATCRKLTTEDTWQLRACLNVHTCNRALDNSMLSASWLSKNINKKVRHNPKMQISTIRTIAKDK